jgi:hypothetical protein
MEPASIVLNFPIIFAWPACLYHKGTHHETTAPLGMFHGNSFREQ